MPGHSVRQASKNMSKSKQRVITKNNNRVEAAICGSLEGCTYGRIIKNYGNKFLILNASKREHQAHMRGKMARIGVDDIVLLSERDYETRSGTEKAVYDIMAVLEKKDVAMLIKSGELPKWMLSTTISEDTTGAGAGVEDEDIFDYTDILTIKRREIDLNDEDIDIDKI